MKSVQVLFASIIFLSSIGVARAASITYYFTATNFVPESNNPIPTSSIAGSFTVDGSTVTQIDLVVGLHKYSVNEVAFGISQYSGRPTLYGVPLGPGISLATDDFWLSGNYNMSRFISFAYSVSGVNDLFATTVGTISVDTVPLPTTAWLFGSGLIGLTGLARQRKRVALVGR